MTSNEKQRREMERDKRAASQKRARDAAAEARASVERDRAALLAGARLDENRGHDILLANPATNGSDQPSPEDDPVGAPGMASEKYQQALEQVERDATPACTLRLNVVGDSSLASRYGRLVDVLEQALQQASFGKGSERHDQSRERFDDQQIVQLPKWMGTNHFDIGQACKKALESCHLPNDRAIRELLGAINYLAAAVIHLEDK